MKFKGWLITTAAFSFLLLSGVFLMSNKTTNKTLRVAFPSTRKAIEYEPTRIHLGFEYIFLENLFSTLVEMDNKGSIQAGIAEKVDWIEDELRLKIRSNFKTASGKLITSDDVIFSLKRLLVLSENTHGNFKDIVCPNTTIKSVDENCPGIRKDGDYIYLNAKGGKSFILPMLTAIDFAIIPRSSTDEKTLAIVNYSETSGPYYVNTDDGQGNIEFKLNPHHYHAAPNIAESIKLVPTNTKILGDSLRLLKENLVDHLTTVDAAKADELLPFATNNNDYNIHMTMKIKSLVLVFTEKGYSAFSAEERRYIGNRIRLAFTKIYKNTPGYEQRAEFFPSLGDGGISEDQQKMLVEIRKKESSSLHKTFKLGLIKRGPLEAWSKDIIDHIPEADCYIETNSPDLKKNATSDEVPHAFIASTDTGFMEDITLISYSLNAGLLGLKKTERSKWMAEYMALDDKTKRIEKLKELHFHALSEPWTVPLMASPYSAVVRKPWKVELSELFANNKLWHIKTL